VWTGCAGFAYNKRWIRNMCCASTQHSQPQDSLVPPSLPHLAPLLLLLLLLLLQLASHVSHLLLVLKPQGLQGLLVVSSLGLMRLLGFDLNLQTQGGTYGCR
jgi:hypothetical protein